LQLNQIFDIIVYNKLNNKTTMTDIQQITYYLNGKTHILDAHELMGADGDSLQAIQQAVSQAASQVLNPSGGDDGRSDAAIPQYTKIEYNADDGSITLTSDHNDTIQLNWTNEEISFSANNQDHQTVDESSSVDNYQNLNESIQKIARWTNTIFVETKPSSREDQEEENSPRQHNVGSNQTLTIPGGSGGTVVVNCGGGHCCRGGGGESSATNTFILQQILQILQQITDDLRRRREPSRSQEAINLAPGLEAQNNLASALNQSDSLEEDFNDGSQ